MGHDIDDRCDVDIDSIDAIEDRNRWLDSIRFPPQRHLCGRGFLGILFFKMRHAAIWMSYLLSNRETNMQFLLR